MDLLSVPKWIADGRCQSTRHARKVKLLQGLCKTDVFPFMRKSNICMKIRKEFRLSARFSLNKNHYKVDLLIDSSSFLSDTKSEFNSANSPMEIK